MPNFNNQGWAYVVELDADVRETPDFETLVRGDPLVTPDKSAMFVNSCHIWPARKFPDDDFSESSNSILKRFGHELREDLQGPSRSKALTLHRDVETIVNELRGRGHPVFTSPQLFPASPSSKTHSVYVVLLPDQAKEDPSLQNRLHEASSEEDEGMPCVYVGETGRTPTERLKLHLEGSKGNRFVKRYGGKLVPSLYQHLNPLTKLEALRVERDLAHRLAFRAGYWILSN